MKSKIKGSLTIISILLIIIIGMGMVSASDNDTLSLQDSNSDIISANESGISSDDGKYFEDIQTQIDNAKDNDTITLEEGVYTPKSSEDNYNTIQINKSIKIVGKDTTLDTKGLWGVFNINSSGNVIIENIKFINTYGAAVVVQNTNTCFTNCNFESNHGSTGSALLVYASDNDVTTNIDNCIFKDNVADLGGGSAGGAIFINSYDCQVNTTITNSLFANNSAAKGGAIFIGCSDKKSNSLKIINSDFVMNTVIDQKYDIVENTAADIQLSSENNFETEITNSHFINKKHVGELQNLVASESLVLLNSKNKFSNVTFENSSVFFNKTDAVFENCDFKDSRIDEVYDADSEMTPKYIKLNINNSILENSNIYLGSGKIENSTIIKSNINKESGDSLIIDCCNFADQSEVLADNEINILNSNFINSQLTALDYINLTVDNTTFKNHIAVIGAAISANQIESDKKSSISILNSKFINNTARYWGGAISIDLNCDFEIKNSLFINNSARNGGAIFASAGNGKISNSIFDGNKAIDNDNATFDYLNKTYKSTGVPIEYWFGIYQEKYDMECPDWENEYRFPDYTYGTLVRMNDDVPKTIYYGSAIFADNITAENNFWGLNIDNASELKDNLITSVAPKTWINYKDGAFVLNNGSAPADLPAYTPINPEKQTAVINITQNGDLYHQTNLTIKLSDAKTNNPIANQEIIVCVSDGEFDSVITDEKGTAIYEILDDAGIKNVIAIAYAPEYKATSLILENVSINKIQSVATVSKLSTTYNSGKKLTVTVKEKSTGKLVKTADVTVKVFTGKKYKTFSAVTNSKGQATFNFGTSVAVGSHKVEVTCSDFNYAFAKKTTTVKITKAKTTIKAPKVTNKVKKSKFFKVTVKNKATKKVVKNTKVKVKVYTGKKYKTFTIKTNSKGVAKLNTKSLKVGSHKVVVSSGNTNYIMSAKSTIVIKR